ncbi:calcium/sodium antiporter [Alkaliphilus serpentinus]|nr:calcium/sodium antiporter [Alkaliphilus serpentinus]
MYLFLILGLVILVKGADYFVEGASKIATYLRIPPILIGLTIVAFGTSAPEAAVSISAALKGSGSIALGNVVGSNIFNITFILGLAAFIYPLKVERETIRKEIPFALLASVLMIILINDIRLQGFSTNLITRADGLVLLSFFMIFLYYIFEVARNSREKSMVEDIELDTKSLGKNILFTIGGLMAIIFGGDQVVRSSIKIAYSLGMSETLVGLTIVAVGTSLPELITSVTAAIKKKSEIALGNVVGSNIFNVFFILGISAVITPLSVDSKMFVDALVMVLSTVVVLVFSKTHLKLSKLEGSLLAIAFIAYMIFIIIRN